MDELFGGDGQLMLILTVVGILILLAMIVIIRIGLKNSQKDDLLVAPSSEELDNLAVGERMAVLPERPDIVVENAPSVLNPDRPKNDAVVGGLTGGEKPAPSPWDNQPKIGDNEVESGYSEDQLMEREIKALLLQGRADRAVQHVMSVKKIDEGAAETIVAQHIKPDQA